jgi:phosphoglycerate dehydrogenase-like enzyme
VNQPKARVHISAGLINATAPADAAGKKTADPPYRVAAAPLDRRNTGLRRAGGRNTGPFRDWALGVQSYPIALTAAGRKRTIPARMKILYTPLLIVPSLDTNQRLAILEAAGPGGTLVEAKDAAQQRTEIADADVLFGRVPNDVFVLGRRLRYYQSIGAGVDAILTPELIRSTVLLASEKGEVGIHLAEHAFALLLGLTRGVHTALRHPHYENREPIRRAQRELFDLTMGILGLGGTGREVARRALGFGMRVLAVDIEDVPTMPGIAALWKPDRMDELLGQSDVVVICLPLTKATHHLFTRDRFRRMRPSAILINVTRGAIVYGEDLLAALDQGLLGGAGLDVTDPEPLPPGHPLWSHPRVIVTPHTAGGSPRRAQRVVDTFCENLRRLRAGRPLLALIDKEKGY